MNIFKEFSRKRKPMATKKPALLVNDDVVLQTFNDEDRQRERIVNAFMKADPGRSHNKVNIYLWIRTVEANYQMSLDRIEAMVGEGVLI